MHAHRCSAALLLAAACATAPMNRHDALTSPEAADLARAMRSPLEFDVPIEEAFDAWGRAQAFIQAHGRSDVEVATDALIRSGPIDCEAGPGARYEARKTRLGPDRVHIEIGCWTCWIDPQQTRINAQVAAHYVRTGELVCDRSGFNACVVK